MGLFLRFTFLFGPYSKPLDDETEEDWKLRLMTSASECEIDTVTTEEIVDLVMCKNAPDRSFTEQILDQNGYMHEDQVNR